MKKPLELVVIVDGGLVQEVCSPDPAIVGQTVVVIDFDTEGCDDSELTDLFGEGAPSYMHVEFVQRLGSETAVKLQEWRDAQ